MKTISAYKARQKFGELLETVHYRDDEVTILRSGKPMAILISPNRYHRQHSEDWTDQDRREWDRLSTRAFEKVWDNDNDREYDHYDLANLTPYQTPNPTR